jgi:hypothetical protein
LSGTTLNIRRLAILSAACVQIAIVGLASPASSLDFLVRGISLSSVSLVPGADVSYLVVSESFGATDSSFVELRVLDHARGEFVLQIVTGPYPPVKKELVTVRLRLAEPVLSISSADEFGSCLKEILIREGTGRFRAPTARELEDLDIERLFLRPSEGTERLSLGEEEIASPAGAFSCRGSRISWKQTRPVDLGGIPGELVDQETSTVWISPLVPLWGLVKSSVEERSFTTVSGAETAPGSKRATVTESILISFKKPRGRP